MTINRYTRTSWIKKNQKQSLLFKEISQLIQQATIDHPELNGFYISKVELSDDKGICFIYFFSEAGPALFKPYLEILKLYKPSMRKALADNTKGRRVPQLVFKYDDNFAKQSELEALLETVKAELNEEE